MAAERRRHHERGPAHGQVGRPGLSLDPTSWVRVSESVDGGSWGLEAWSIAWPCCQVSAAASAVTSSNSSWCHSMVQGSLGHELKA